jgi:hypothetical protein
MPTRRLIPVLLLFGLLAIGAGDAGETSDPAEEAALERVVVLVNRNREVPGYVVLEDADVIIVRTPDSRLESFSKTRLVKIVRLVEPEPGQTGVVFLRNGQQREGIVLEDAFDYVRLEIDGIEARLPRGTVDHVMLEPTFDERYAQYKAALAGHQPDRHLELCRWLVNQRRYDLALVELKVLMANDPPAGTRHLLNLVEAQLALQAEARRTPPDEEDAAHGEPSDGEYEPPGGLISRDDVNLIRVFEIDFDRPPKVSVEPHTIQAMIDTYAASGFIPRSESERRALFRAEPLEIVELLFKLRARELYPQIKVITEPWALNLFRRRVHNTWLLNNCATSRCHGGAGAGRFYLHRHRYKDERVRYTNLLILHRLELDPQWPLLNYDEPMMSLIIQYGLPRQQARHPHPDVKGWKPVFGPGGQRMLRDTLHWLDAMMKPRPWYPVEYEPPLLGGDRQDSGSPEPPDHRTPR